MDLAVASEREDRPRQQIVFPIFSRWGESLHLDEIYVYADGQIWWPPKPPFDLDRLRQYLAQGRLATHLRPGESVQIHRFGRFRAEQVDWVRDDEFVKEVADAIATLNGRPSTRRRCADAWQRFQQDPSDANRQALYVAYVAVPAHLRTVLGDRDDKDKLIRRALGLPFSVHHAVPPTPSVQDT